MRTSTMFDLASVTKVMATTMATMLLVDRGKIDVDAPVSRYLPDFRGVHLDSITVRHLLQHSAGLVQWQPLYYNASNGTQTYAVIRDMPLRMGRRGRAALQRPRLHAAGLHRPAREWRTA